MLIKTVAIYNRISRDNGESDDILLNHRTISTRLCESKGYKYMLYEEVESDGKFEERGVLRQLLSDIEQGVYDRLVVVELSRIARDNFYSQMIARLLEDNNVPIITPNRIYNLSDDSDRLMYDMESMISSKELRTITRRMKNGKLEGARRGEWVQGAPPLGYKRGNNKKLVIVESEASLVRQIFTYAENRYGTFFLTKVFEQEFADTVFHDERFISEYSQHVQTQIEKFILNDIIRHGYTTKDRILRYVQINYSQLQPWEHGFKKVKQNKKSILSREFDRSISEIKEKYNLDYRKANKELKEKIQIGYK